MLTMRTKTIIFKKSKMYVDYENQDYYFQKKQYDEHLFELKQSLIFHWSYKCPQEWENICSDSLHK